MVAPVPAGAGPQVGQLVAGVAERGGTVVSLVPLAGDELRALTEGLVGGRPGQRLAQVVAQAGGTRCM